MSLHSGTPWPFFLSYAHYPPSAGARNPANHVVARFYADLCQTLGRLTGQLQPVRGFFDADLPPHADRETARAGAMATARVFLPLYSPTYFIDPVSSSEHSQHQSRHSDPASVRILPILWTTFTPGEHTAETQSALRIVSDPVYAENGLRALYLVAAYKQSCASVVERFAEQLLKELT